MPINGVPFIAKGVHNIKININIRLFVIFVTSEIRRKIQTFENRRLRYILRIWWPKIISNKDLWRATGQEDTNLEIRKRKFRWIGHTLRKEDGEYQKPPYYGTLKEAEREEDLRLAGEDRSPKKWVEAGMNYGS